MKLCLGFTSYLVLNDQSLGLDGKAIKTSRRSVSPDRTGLKRDTQSSMSNLTPPKDSGHMISYKLSSYQIPL